MANDIRAVVLNVILIATSSILGPSHLFREGHHHFKIRSYIMHMNSSNEIHFSMLLLNCTLVSLGEEPDNAEGDTLTLNFAGNISKMQNKRSL